ncbi:MAG TPA: putative molybdenum carrier protein [Desulfobacterales bacterium]|nr:putative molybdenum carrier protein [Desulfobacterales bacterium]
MLKKIISGGQTEADRAALDIAMKLRIPHGGWIPKGRMAEAGPLPEHYKLQEMETEKYSECIKQNVMDSTGTLIISYGSLTGDLDHARKSALRYGRQMLGIDFNHVDDAKAASLLNDWIQLYRIDVLHVIGPSAEVNPYVRNQTENMIEGALTMGYLGK